MSPSSWLSWPLSSSHTRRGQRRNQAARPKKARLFLEQLESRVTPSFGLSSLAFFNGANGANPQAGLIMDGSGNLYGTTENGGANGSGTVFEIAKGSSTITVLASFNGTNGASPQAGLVMDSSGNLYGTTTAGGTDNDGTVFELAKVGSTYSGTITAQASFSGPTAYPKPLGLILDGSGNLYGTTLYGGANGYGSVFELVKGSGTITILWSFNSTDGAYPSGIIMDSSGNLYGTAFEGGASDDGTIFELAKGSSTITTVASFNGGNGSQPLSGLIMDSSGNFYGSTGEGGAIGSGTVFELAKGSSRINSLASFNGSDGVYPSALIMDSSGNLYGTAPNGGADGDGTIFELAKGSSTITDLGSFNGSNGSEPSSGLIMDSSGNLYGTTSGSDEGDGTVFELLPHTPSLSWSTPAAITYGTALSSAQLDATAADSVTGAAVAGTFVYTPAAGTILQAGNKTLSVTFTPTDITDYSPITTVVPLVVNQDTPVLTWNTPAPITTGTALSSTQLDATAANPNNGSPVSGTFVYTPGPGTIVGRGTTTLSVTFTPTDTIDYTTATASVTLVVGPSAGLSTLGLFYGSNGEYPIGALIMDSSGNLYGTTASGGASGDGTVFELAKGSGTITTLASFDGADGADPRAGLCMDTSGNFYGTTAGGGADSYGTIFELAKGSSTITVLASFNGSDGADPAASLVMDESGNLYGTTQFGAVGWTGGGVDGDGTVFELAKVGSTYSSTISTLASFNFNNGANPVGPLVMDRSGNFYGTTQQGGAGGANNGVGTVFELAAGTSAIATLASFYGGNGAYPAGPLIMDSSGNLYGTTDEGGPTWDSSASVLGDGTVFELAKVGGTYSSTISILASFTGSDGANPAGGVIRDSNGNLYGTTTEGGAVGDGSLFELANGRGTLSTLASFSGSNGASPYAGLIMDSSGNLYGTTPGEGDGNVFELVPHTPSLSWSTPAAITYGTALSSTQLDASAADSGTGAAVAGTFVYTPAAGTILHGGNQTLSVTFTPTDTTDYSPITTEVPLLVNQVTPVLTWNTPAPITYGTPLGSTQLDATAADPNTGSPLGGTFVYAPGPGTIIPRGTTTLTVNFTPTDAADYTTAQASVELVVTPSNTVSTLTSFNGTNGSVPRAALVADGSGNFYGTTYEGGGNHDGTIFMLATGSSTLTTLASFNGTNGDEPAAGLIIDSSGNLYGTTVYGGASGDGTVFELVKGSSTITTLASFNGTDGRYPYAGLIMDSSGNLYGTASAGGASSDGTVFELAHGSGTITTLVSFNGTDGKNPYAGLIMDSSGNLFGTTDPGSEPYGTVFELAHGSGTITTLASFNGTDGKYPYAGLIMDSSGNLYGTASAGGATSDGTVFELAHGSRTITTLASFNGTDGSDPVAALIMDSSGNLYGTTEKGGASSDGTVFELAQGIGALTTLASFNGSDGANPYAALILESGGNLFGTTYYGGASGDGTVFELPATAQPSLRIGGFPSSTSAGTAQTFTVTVLNADGTTDTGYTGTVHFASTDPQAVLPADYTFTPTVAGVHTFTATLETAGTQSITVSDTSTSSITGTVSGIGVQPAAAHSFTITGLAAKVSAGTSTSFTLTAYDAYGNIATGFTGTVQFTSSDSQASLPSNYTFTSANAGTHTFSITFETTGTQSITTTDMVATTITASASSTVLSSSILFQDTFSESAISSAWSFVGGTWQLNNGALSQTSTAAGDPKKAMVTNQTFPSNVMITAEVEVNSWTAGGYARAGVGLYTNTSSGLGYNLVFHGTNQVQFLDDHVAWGNAYTFDWQVGTWYWFQLEENNGTLYGKVWAAGTAEPENWMYEQTGWTDRTGGAPALNGSSASSTAGSATVSFESVSVTTTNVQPDTANAGPAQTIAAGSPVTFSQAIASGTGPLSYAWNFGDGTTSTGTLYVTHTYESAGRYTATLTVTDALAIPVVSTVTITVDASGSPADVLLGQHPAQSPSAGSPAAVYDAAIGELVTSSVAKTAADENGAGNRIGALDFGGDDNRPVVPLVLGETSTNSNALDRYTRQRPL